MPDIRIATLGSKPISNGASTVAPNIATTCCTPRASDVPSGSRWSGATTPPPCVFVHCVKYEDIAVSVKD
jgi:hypothetical protein